MYSFSHFLSATDYSKIKFKNENLLKWRVTSCQSPYFVADAISSCVCVFFCCLPIEVIVYFSAPEVCSLDFCLPLASHLLLLHRIPKCQAMNI